MKIDPYKNKERFEKWKILVQNRGIPDINPENSQLIVKYVLDMESGMNVSIGNKKGARSFSRLNNLAQRMIFLTKSFEKNGIVKLTEITEEQLVNFFHEMRSGTMTRKDGEKYKSVADYIKVFKAFWHWHQRIASRKGENIQDITKYLDTTSEKPEWVYLTEEQVKRLCENANFKYRVLMTFLYDTGIRAPTELMNIRVSDLYNNCKELNVREEISKTFGRRIKLMLSSQLLKDYIQSKCLKGDDYIFSISPKIANQYLQRLAVKVLGDGMSEAGQKYSQLTMYDFRHCSCCYWLPRYKSESALKYRFGWKKSDKIHYYSELLGMKDTIQEEDLLVDVTKTEIEKKLMKSENEKEVMQERMQHLETQMQRMLEMLNKGLRVVEV